MLCNNFLLTSLISDLQQLGQYSWWVRPKSEGGSYWLRHCAA